MSHHHHKVTMLGTGLIGMFYTMTLHSHRGQDRVHMVYSRTAANAQKFATEWGIPRFTDDMEEAINDPETDVVVIGLPNNLHRKAVELAVKAGKAILCTKPLAMNGKEALELLELVEQAGIFHGYLEDLCYTPKTLKALESVQRGAVGEVTWTRAREAHPGPHSDWFWDPAQSGGGAIIDLGCHCIEIGRNYIGKNVRPIEVMCWADTLVKPIKAEDNAIALIKYETGAISQIEVSWSFRGGMDLRDEVAGTEGSLRTDHWLRTGLELFTAQGTDGYVSEKAESETGWLFPVGDEVHSLGYTHMFTDMFDAWDQGKTPMETFYDGYIVNAIMDACYLSAKSKKWEPIHLPLWRGGEQKVSKIGPKTYDADHWLIKEEKMPDGSKKVILKNKETGEIVQQIV
ncbi:MAG: Gfo/Idh/MocA family oxidoreductase [Saprospiraceae bacterium]